MEFLRRLRLIWACFCVANLGVALYLGAPLMALAAVIGMLCFYAKTSTPARLTVFWFGYVGITAYAVIAPRDPQGALAMVGVITAAWIVVAALAWLLAGLRPTQPNR